MSNNLQPVVLRHAGERAAQSKSYKDKPGAPAVVEAYKETPVKQVKGIRVVSLRRWHSQQPS